MLKKVLFAMVLSVSSFNIAFAESVEKIAIREAIISKDGGLSVITTRGKKYTIFDFKNVTIKIDSKLDDTYVDVDTVRLQSFGSSTSLGIVVKIVVYVRDVSMANRWYFSLTRLEFPEDIVIQ